jgi:tetratricopeptide (TPR) repeat protein
MTNVNAFTQVLAAQRCERHRTEGVLRAFVAGAALLLMVGGSAPLLAEDATEPTNIVYIRPMDELWGKTLLDARAKRDKTDLLLAAFTDRYRWSSARRVDSQYVAPDSPEAAAEHAAVIEAFRDAIAAYPHTEVAAYCSLRLAGAYQYVRQYAKAEATLEQMIEEYATTEYEDKARATLGLMELQGLKNPVASFRHLSEILPSEPPATPEPPHGGMSASQMSYYSAQVQLLRIDTELDEHLRAEARAARLVRMFPGLAEGIGRELKNIRRVIKGDGFVFVPADDAPALDVVAAAEKALEKEEARIRAGRPMYVMVQADAEWIALRTSLRKTRGMKLTDEVRARVKAAEKAEVDLIPALMKEFDRQAGNLSVVALIVAILDERKTDQSAAALKQIAMHPDCITSGVERAVKAYRAQVTDSDAMADLLASENEAARHTAAGEMVAMELTANAATALSRMLASNQRYAHTVVAMVYQQDPSEKTAAFKVAALMNALPALELLEDGGAVDPETIYTNREHVLSAYIGALKEMKGGACDQALAHYAAEGEGLQPVMAVAALGMRGDVGQRERLRKLARSTTDGFVRTLVVQGLAGVANDNDVALLKELAEADPFNRPQSRHDGGPGDVRPEFPVRQAASNALRKLQP